MVHPVAGVGGTHGGRGRHALSPSSDHDARGEAPVPGKKAEQLFHVALDHDP